MKCLNCEKVVKRPRGKTKVLQICGECRGNKGGGYSRQTTITRKEFDLYCIKCNRLIPVGIRRINREMCKGCAKKESNKKFYGNKKVVRFYQFQKIALIQSPYFVERRKIELTI